MAVWSRRRAAVVAAMGLVGAGCAVLGLVLVLAVPGIMRDQVAKNVRIDPSSVSFNMWKELPIPLYFSVHFFEVVNPTEVVNGAKPVVVERGPYVYREHRFKTNITFHDNDTVSFLEYRRFHFQPHMSNGKEEDYIVVPNILLLGGAVMMENLPAFLKMLISSALSGLKQTPFVNRTVGEILWGYDDPLLTILNTFVPGLIPFKGKFGLFTDFNNSNLGLFTVYTGMKDIHKVHMVDTWNGIRKTKYWRSEQCNMINGTSGEMWPPFMTPSTSLEFYSPDACRSMALVYEQSGEFEGIPTFRYVAPKTLFANGTDYPPNEGFCPCRESGIQNVSSCRLNAPVFISQPHFYNADPVLVEAVGGLHPTKEKHGLFLDVHPMTGIPMNCSIKMQMNMFMKRVSDIIQTGNIKPVILPIIWFSERGSLEGPFLKEFYTNLVLIPSVLEHVQYIAIALGTALMTAAILLVLSQRKEARKRGPKEQSPPNGSPQYSETSPLLQDTDTHNQTETAKA